MAEWQNVMTSSSAKAATESFLAAGPGEVITAEYGEPGEASCRRVSVNLSTGTITFYRCHTPSRYRAVYEVLEQAVAKSGSRLRWYEGAAVQLIVVLTGGALLGAGVIPALPEMPRWAVAATIWTMVVVVLPAWGMNARSKRFWW
ncbi:MAG: hypothetical protein U0939_21160 [Pirellulales bacterium]